MKKTPLYDFHLKHNAYISEFAGYYMPIYYKSIIEEHLGVRRHAGLFDVSHMGRLLIEGSGALEYLNNILPLNVVDLPNKKAGYTFFLTEKGTVIDDLIVYKFNNNKFLLVVNAARKNEDISWMLNHKKNYNVSILDITEDTAMIAVQGLNSLMIMDKMYPNIASNLRFFYFDEVLYDNYSIIIARTGYTGGPGVEIILNAEKALRLWDKFFEIDDKIISCGLGARDSLRLEAGLPLYGHELTEEITPIHANLIKFIDFSKEFIGKKALLHIIEKGADMLLTGIVTGSKTLIPRPHMKIKTLNGAEAGYITSGGLSPLISSGIALAYVKREFNNEPEFLLNIRGQDVVVKNSRYPFAKLK